jgi:hypothetical protein
MIAVAVCDVFDALMSVSMMCVMCLVGLMVVSVIAFKVLVDCFQ